jgi:hypothetical protein
MNGMDLENLVFVVFGAPARGLLIHAVKLQERVIHAPSMTFFTLTGHARPFPRLCDLAPLGCP